jgi:hypothetical protein
MYRGDSRSDGVQKAQLRMNSDPQLIPDIIQLSRQLVLVKFDNVCWLRS